MNPKRSYIRFIRYGIQIFFILLTVWIGCRFSLFVSHFEHHGIPFTEKPSSVAAFLPIAGFMATKYFLLNGMIEPAHPAALAMFVAICGTSLLLKKGFCGWICPVGTLSQYLWMLGQKLAGRNYILKPYLDMALRSLKYLLMGAFIFSIGILMTTTMLVFFFITDYHKAVDVRMLHFFTRMSMTTFWVLLILGILSLFYKNFWCRYLCPYGALLGLLSYLSPVKVKRDDNRCIHCKACTKNCPSLITVEQRELITSPECFSCMTCVSHCPSEGALDITIKATRGRRTMKPFAYPLLLVGIFYLVISIFIITGNWKSRIPYEEYQRIIPAITQK